MRSPQGGTQREACRWVRRGTATDESQRQPRVARRTAVCTSAQCVWARGPEGRAHRESARSGDADDYEGIGEGAEVASALPHRQHLVRDRGLLLGLGRLALLELGASLGLVVLVLDLERAELVVPSKDAVALQKGGGALGHTLSSHCGQRSDAEGGRRGCMDRWGRLTIRAPSAEPSGHPRLTIRAPSPNHHRAPSPNHQGTLA